MPAKNLIYKCNNIFEINVGMKKDDLLSISPLDGRYSEICKDIGNIFSEYSLIKYRVFAFGLHVMLGDKSHI